MECVVEQESRRAAIIGAGSMGTLLAAVLGRLMPVVLVCRREDRAAELFRHGARVTGLIEASARPVIVQSVEDIRTAGGATTIFVATKTTAIPGVAADLLDAMPALSVDHRTPFVISFQNGIDPGRELMARLGNDRVLRMVLSLGATLAPDGSAVHVSLNQPPHAIGSIDGRFEDTCRQVASALSAGGLETAYETNIESAVWKKAIVNAAVNPVAALVNCSVGEVLDSPSAVIVDRLMEEGVAVAREEGISLPDDYSERVRNLLRLASDHVPSMVQDIRGGRESEIGQLNRQVIEHGTKLGIATRTHETVDALIETFDWKVYQHPTY